MKVLWFTNVMLPPACKFLGVPIPVRGGWMETLRSVLNDVHPALDLHIASFSNYEHEPFTLNNATYYSIVRDVPSSKIGKVLRNWKHSKFSLSELEQCNDLVISCQPDIIHIHGSENLFGLVQEKTNIPVVISLQGILQSCQYFHSNGVALRERLKLICLFPFIKGYGLMHSSILEARQVKIEARIISKCKHFLGRTDWDRDFTSLVGHNASYHHVARVLRDPFYESVWDRSSIGKSTVFATVSSSIRKGTLVLLDAIGILKKNGYPSIKLRLAGSVKGTPIWPLVEARMLSNQICDDVEFLGPLTAHSLVKELMQSSIFAHPSYIDNSPNSLAEALIIGIPAVATAVGGVPSMLTNLKDGLLCMPGDPFSLAAGIHKILSNEDLAFAISKEARRTALNRHDKAIIVRQLHNAYLDILSN